MKLKLALAGALVFAFVTPSVAQSFYVVRDATTKKCTVVNEKPASSTTTTIVGDGTVYKTRQEAEGAIKTTKVCTSD